MIQMTLKTEFKINKKVVWMMGFITCTKEKAKRELWTLIHSTAKAILIKKTIIDRLWHQAIIWPIKLSTRIKFTLRVLMELILICLGLRFRIKFIILTCDFIRYLRKLLILGDFRRFLHCDSNILEQLIKNRGNLTPI